MPRILFTLSLLLTLICGCSNNDEQLEKAKAFIVIKRYNNAIEQAELAIQKSPKNPEAHLVKGEAYLYNGDFREAEGEFDTAILLQTNMKGKVADVYFQAGRGVVDNELSRAKRFFRKAIDKNPDFGQKISRLFSEKAFSRIELSPDISRNIFRLLELAVEYSPPQQAEHQKEQIASKLFEEALRRKEKGLIESSAALAYKAQQFNPFTQPKVVQHLLELAYYACDVRGEPDYAMEILQEVKTIDTSVENNDKFCTYYYFKTLRAPQDLNVEKAKKFLTRFQTSPYREDVLLSLIEYWDYQLNFDKVNFYLAKIKSDFPNGKYQAELSQIEQKLLEVTESRK